MLTMLVVIREVRLQILQDDACKQPGPPLHFSINKSSIIKYCNSDP